MREYVFVVAALALCARAADPDHGEVAAGPPSPPGLDRHTRVLREVQGLFPFPRVGRAAWPTWSSRESGLGENKRQGLIPFPRVGRSENAEPRAVPRAVPAAWIVAPEYYAGKRVASWSPSSSPRLGRQSKRLGDSEPDTAWTFVDLREYPAMNRPQRGRDSASFTPRLGRELESASDEEVTAHDSEDLQAAGVGVRL